MCHGSVGAGGGLGKTGCKMTYGDVLFVLNLPFPLGSLKALALWARLLMPIISRLPFRLVYPTGERQKGNQPRQVRRFIENDIIPAIFILSGAMLLHSLPGKTITSTVTPADIEDLRNRRVKTLITTTPDKGVPSCEI